MLVGLLRYIELNMERLLIENPVPIPQVEIWTPEKLKQKFEEEARKAEEEEQKRKLENPKAEQEDEEENEGEESSEGEEEDESEDISDEDEPQLSTFASSTAHRGTQMKAETVKLTGIGIARLTRVPLVVVCERCRTQAPLDLNAGDTIVKECDKCHENMNIGFRNGKTIVLLIIIFKKIPFMKIRIF